MAEKAFEMNVESSCALEECAYGTDSAENSDKSSSGHNYTKIYSHYFDSIKDKNLKFLEIGIYKGYGARLWENYFQNAELHFIDITYDQVKYSSYRSQYHLVNQEDPKQLTQLMADTGGNFDIILDDGGHTMNQQIVSFMTLFPYLNSGGMYIIEDLHTSYWKDFGGGGSRQNPLGTPTSTVEFLKNLIDDVNFIGARTGRANHDVDLSPIQSELTPYRDQILSMHFYDSLCFIIKR